MKTLYVAVCAALLAAPVSAATYALTEELTSTGQDLTFQFDGLVASDGTGGMLTLSSVKGLDLGVVPNEYMDVSIDGDDYGRWVCDDTPASGATDIPGAVGTNGCKFSLELAITDSDLTGFLADGSITVLAVMGSGVSAFGGAKDLTAVLNYTATAAGGAQVPLPASALMLGAGVAATAAARRRKG